MTLTCKALLFERSDACGSNPAKSSRVNKLAHGDRKRPRDTERLKPGEGPSVRGEGPTVRRVLR